MANRKSPTAVDLLQEAWERGFRIIAAELNPILARLKLHIPAVKPAEKDTLALAKNTMCRMLQVVGVQFPHILVNIRVDADIEPWTIGHPFGKDNYETRIGGKTPQELKSQLDSLAKCLSQSSYTPAIVKTLIVDEIMREAKLRREWFAQLRGKPREKRGPKRGDAKTIEKEERLVLRYETGPLTKREFVRQNNCGTLESFTKTVRKIHKRRLRERTSQPGIGLE